MDVDSLQLLLAYNHWANERLLAIAEEVPAERLHEHFGGGADTIPGTFAHLLGAERTWFHRWNGESPRGGIHPSDLSDLATLRQQWAELRREVDLFVDWLTPERLAQPVRYVNDVGEIWEYPLWQMIVHVVNHGTHHRSEIADLLTRVGHPPPPLDFLVYFDLMEEERDRAERGEES